MQLYAIRRRSAWADETELSRIAALSKEIGETEMADQVRWIRTYVIKEGDGRLGSICIYEATDEASLKEHARRVGMPGDDIVSVVETVVVRPDPARAEAA